MLFPFTLTCLLMTTPEPADVPRPDRCIGCQASITELKQDLRALHTGPWRRRDRAAHDLAECRRECHPEVVTALTDSLRHDERAEVRAEAAESLGRLVPLVPASHVALDEASRLDPAAAVRKQAGRSLAAKGLRCVTDCPICGPLPKAAAITGPVLKLPELDQSPGEKLRKPVDPVAAPTTSLPPALPDPKP